MILQAIRHQHHGFYECTSPHHHTVGKHPLKSLISERFWKNIEECLLFNFLVFIYLLGSLVDKYHERVAAWGQIKENRPHQDSH